MAVIDEPITKNTNLASSTEKPSMVRVNFDLEKDQHTKLKVYAAQHGRTIADILRDLVNQIDDQPSR